MLVLTRKIGEQIIINENIQLTILEIQAGRVRIGITAPAPVRVDRGEVHQRRAEFGQDQTQTNAQLKPTS